MNINIWHAYLQMEINFNYFSEFHGLDMNVLIKALKTLEINKKCEIIEFDDNQGVKFF